MPAEFPPGVRQLVENFENDIAHYTSSTYNETQLRREFLDPLFKELGWDIDNSHGYAHAYKDVVHEDAVKIGGTTKAPDYSFRIGGTRKFFVEAKRPAVNIARDVASAYQLRRYAWSAKLPVSVLTNFKQLAVYDTRVKPAAGDPASSARILLVQFDEFQAKWADVAGVFSRNAILKGSFDKYAEGKKRRGTAEVDDAFLGELERWRELLAIHFARRNPTLGLYDLNYAVQQTIDRIVFLRMCEDRGTEDYGTLQAAGSGSGTYERLQDLFEKADQRYNSGLFHFSSRRNEAEAPDELTPSLRLDDKPLKEIIGRLYYPESPYEFSVLPSDILGQVYERFLGKTITLTKKHEAKVEEKPEVRNAGGVFYTPGYIVEYMVGSTLGPLLLTPSGAPVSIAKAAEIRVIDPACGSGSFLLVAYQYLLDWHLGQYAAKPSAHLRGPHPKIYQRSSGEFRLTTAERKRILLNNVFGVDIDRQAVEVTKLSLLLKVLEGETEQVIQRDWVRERERILPDLDGNIRCGNALVEPDFYAQEPDLWDDEDYRHKLNAFDWRREFAGVAPKGFHCVIGNPPYIFTRDLISQELRRYYAAKYRLGWEKQNTYFLFMERLLELLRPDGVGSFIVPNSWLTMESAKLIRKEYVPRLKLVADLNYQPFRGVSMEPTIFIVAGKSQDGQVSCARVSSSAQFKSVTFNELDRESWEAPDHRVVFGSVSSSIHSALAALKKRLPVLGDCFDVRTGLQAYEQGKGSPAQTASDVKRHVFDATEQIDSSYWRYLEGRDVCRYSTNWSGNWLSYGPWLSQPREPGMFRRPRVLVREITSPPPFCFSATFTSSEFLNNKSVLNVLDTADDEARLKLLALVLNSTVASAFYMLFSVKAERNVFPKIVVRALRELPIPAYFSKDIVGNTVVTRGVALHKRMTELLKRMETGASMTPRFERDRQDLNDEIDRFVMELYEVSSSEKAGLLSVAHRRDA